MIRSNRNPRTRWAAWIAAGALLMAAPAAAVAASLFDPTPQDAMRPLSTDRPDVTESPYTVDAGHIQVEVEVFALSHYEAGGLEVDELRLLQTNLKVGLLDRVDLQIVLTPYVKQELDITFLGVPLGPFVDSDDILLRLKVNLTGNDGGPVAVALLPFIAPPTRSVDGFGVNREPTYGIAVPLALELPHEFGLGLMGQYTHHEDEKAYLMTTSLARGLGGSWGGFVEIAAERVDLPDAYFSPVGPTDYWNTTLDMGLTFGVTADLQLDGAVLIGLTDEADDWTTYLGLTVRR